MGLKSKVLSSGSSYGVVLRNRGGNVLGRNCGRNFPMRRRRRPRVEGSTKSEKAIEKRVEALKKLIPNTKSMGLDGLFRETVDYVWALETKVRLMSIMVEVLTGSYNLSP